MINVRHKHIRIFGDFNCGGPGNSGAALGRCGAILARAVKFIREIIWKITDASEQIREQIDREVPINDMIRKTTDDVIGAFSTKNERRKTTQMAASDNNKKRK